jgi:lipopolysaccharide export system protein LptC
MNACAVVHRAVAIQSVCLVCTWLAAAKYKGDRGTDEQNERPRYVSGFHEVVQFQPRGYHQLNTLSRLE